MKRLFYILAITFISFSIVYCQDKLVQKPPQCVWINIDGGELVYHTYSECLLLRGNIRHVKFSKLSIEWRLCDVCEYDNLLVKKTK